MRRMSRRFLTGILALVALIVFSVPASARESYYIRKTSGVIAGVGNGEIGVDFSILAKRDMDSIGATKITLYTTTDDYVDTIEYTDDGYGYMMTSGQMYHNARVYFDCVPGESYYAVITFYAGDNTGGDTDILTTKLAEAF